jgi:hypothetical protein
MSLMTGHVDDDRHRPWPPSINARAILNHCLTIGLAGCDGRVSVMAAHRPDVCGSKDREDHSRASGGKRFPTYPANQAHIRSRVMGGATRPRRDERGAIAGETGDTVAVGRIDGFG